MTFTVETYPGLKKLLEEDPDFLQSLMDFELLDLAFQFHILATATAMSADEFVGYQRQRRGDALAIQQDAAAPESLKTLASSAQTFGDLYLAALTEAGVLRSEDEPPLIRLQPEFGGLAVIHAGLLGGPGGASLIADGQQAIQIEGDADGDGQVTKASPSWPRHWCCSSGRYASGPGIHRMLSATLPSRMRRISIWG